MSEKRDALYALWQAYLHISAWRTADYKRLDPEDRAIFAELVRKGRLFGYVEDTKLAALRAGVDLDDDALSVLRAASITPAAGLTERERAELIPVLRKLYATMVREEGKSESDSLRPLPDMAARVLKMLQELPPHHGLVGSDIIDRLQRQGICLEQNALTSRIIPKLRPYGVRNEPGAGYYIDSTHSAAKKG